MTDRAENLCNRAPLGMKYGMATRKQIERRISRDALHDIGRISFEPVVSREKFQISPTLQYIRDNAAH